MEDRLRTGFIALTAVVVALAVASAILSQVLRSVLHLRETAFRAGFRLIGTRSSRNGGRTHSF